MLKTKPYTRATVREGMLVDAHNKLVLSNLPYHSEAHDVRQEDIDFILSQYDGAIRYTDAKIPELLDALHYDAGQDMLVITADHGEQFFEHGFFSHGKLLFTEETNVPLLVNYAPWKPAVHATPVSLLDLFPTLCDLYGVRRPDGLAGVSLLPVLQGEPPASRLICCEGPDWFGPHAAVVQDGYLYYLNARMDKLMPWRIWRPAEGLFDLASDYACEHNLAAAEPDRAAHMNALLRELNPRYRNLTPDRVRGADADVALGRSLLETADGTTTSWELKGSPSVMPLEEGDVRFEGEPVQIVLEVPGESVRSHCVLEVRYILKSGRLVIEWWRGGETHAHYEYECRKPTADWTTVRKTFWVDRERPRIVIRMTVPGKARVAPPRVLPIETNTTFPIVPVEVAAESAPSEEPMTDAERERLEALGYI
jgi:hypothetical protein